MESAHNETAQAHASGGIPTLSQLLPSMASAEARVFSSSQSGEDASPSPSVPTPQGNLTFLVQPEPSTSTSTPPSSSTGSDKFAHTRGKRRRTSPEDFAILEAEYERNPRPDKIARAGVVARVSMTDKEVQIWFQNRRQISRRKARTWQPNAITSIIRESHRQGLGDNESPSSSFSASSQVSSSQPQLESSQPQLGQDEHVGSSQSSAEAGEEIKETPTGLDTIEQRDDVKKSSITSEVDEKVPSDVSVGTSADPQDVPHLDASGNGDDTIKSSSTQGLGITSGPDDEQPTSSGVSIVSQAHCSEMHPAKKRRSVRLVCSEDGLAEVVLKSASVTPEKPAPKPNAVDSSLFASSQPAPPSASTVRAVPKPRVHGRSRDSRAWEFYCDSDSRDALTTLADRECKGSALGKLSLIRSNSAGSKPLLPTNKQTTQPFKDEQTKRKDPSSLAKERPKLARTTSSLARLQYGQDKGALGEHGMKKNKSTKPMAIFEDPDGDSDKENWEPGTQISRPRYRSHANPSRVNAILQTNTRELSHSSSLGVMIGRERAQKAGFRRERASMSSLPHDQENVQVDEDVAQFIGEESYGQGNDVDDAVHSLLSLSQGEWR